MERNRRIDISTDDDMPDMTTAMYPPCFVCNGPANGFHYGVNTCDACKGFFHRSMRYHSRYTCQEDGRCVIQYGTGKMCQMCRYQKCLAVGLSKKAIRKGRYRSEVKKQFRQQAKQFHRDIDPEVHSSSEEVTQSTRPSRSLLSSISTITSRASNLATIESLNGGHTTFQSEYSSVPIDLSQREEKVISSDFLMSPCPDSRSITTPRPDSRSITTPRPDSRSITTPRPDSRSITMPRPDSRSVTTPPPDSRSVTTPPSDSTPSHPFNSVFAKHPSNIISAISHPKQNQSCYFDACSCLRSPCPEGSLSWAEPSPSSKASSASPRSNLSDHMFGLNSEDPSDSMDASQSHLSSQSMVQQAQEDILRLYSDRAAVRTTLVEAYEVALGSHLWTTEEAIKNTRKHFEACQIRSEVFGGLKKLPDEENDHLYSNTDIDADGRQHILGSFRRNVENFIRRLVKFVKAIPGFAYVTLDEKKQLIKYCRMEFSILLNYTCANLELGVYRCIGLGFDCSVCAKKDNREDIHKEYISIIGELQKLGLPHEERVLLSAICVMAPDRCEQSGSSLVPYIHDSLIQVFIECLARRTLTPHHVYSQILDIRARFINLEIHIKRSVKEWGLRKYAGLEDKPFFRELASDFYI